MYQKVAKLLRKMFRDDQVFKYGFNFSPMYRRSTGRIRQVSRDLLKVEVEIPLSYKNRNYVGAIFGGSMLSATDPIYMIQLMHILGDQYVVWDKSATIKYRRPARENINATFEFSEDEILTIKNQVSEQNEIDLVKKLNILNTRDEVVAQLEKTIYIASKTYYKKKQLARGRRR